MSNTSENELQVDPYTTDIMHSFSRSVAKKYGVNAALVFGTLSHRINHSRNFRDGRPWYFDTISNIAKNYPYLKRTAIYEGVRRLTRKDGLLITSNYNKKGYDRTTWYAFNKPETSKLAGKNLVYFKVRDACMYEVSKAVLLGNLRYWIDKNRLTNPNYQLHTMSATELAEVLPFSRATIQRRLKELVEVDGELISVAALDGREPAKYGFAGEVRLVLDFGADGKKVCENPPKNADCMVQPRISTLASSDPNQAGATPNAAGSDTDNNTMLIDNCLKETI